MTPKPQRYVPLALLLITACSGPAPVENNAAAGTTAPLPTTSSAMAAKPPAMPPPEPVEAAPEPSAPDERPGVAVDATAAAAVQTLARYHRLIARHDYAPAWALWSDGGRASGMSEPAFAESFARYASWDATIGTPGRPEGAAGSVYIDIPVTVTGALVNGEPFRLEGPMTLRRVNDVPGSTAEQRRWHIAASGLKPRPERD